MNEKNQNNKPTKIDRCRMSFITIVRSTEAFGGAAAFNTAILR